MKKYITIAALLAAGTAFANAEESNLLALDMVSNWTDLSITTPTNASLSSSNSGIAWENGSNLTESWQLSFNWKSSNTNTPLELFGTNGSSQDGAKGIVLQYTNGALQLNNRGDTTYASIAITSLPATETAVTITYLKSDNDSYASTLVLQYAGETAYGAAPSTNTTFIYNGNTRLWTNGGKDVFSNITLKSAGAIPEPSAFGLLAGLGALALVASRRRRK